MRGLVCAVALVAVVGMIAAGSMVEVGSGSGSGAWTVATAAPGSSFPTTAAAGARAAALTPRTTFPTDLGAASPWGTRLATLGLLALICGGAALLRRRQGNFLAPQLSRAA